MTTVRETAVWDAQPMKVRQKPSKEGPQLNGILKNKTVMQ